MKTRLDIKKLVAVAGTVWLGACASAPALERTDMGDDAAGLWSRTCSHCHNLRPAPEFTAEQWSIIVTHMRTHGDLTRSEAVAIAEYLRSVRERSTNSP